MNIKQVPQEPEDGRQTTVPGTRPPRRTQPLPRPLRLIPIDRLAAVCFMNVAEDVQCGPDAPRLGEQERAACGVDRG